MAQSLMLVIEGHFAKHGWKPTTPFRCAVSDEEMGCVVTYWQNKYSGEIKMFVIDSFSDECPCAEM